MAEHTVNRTAVDDYLVALGDRLRGRSDREEILAEVGDHLLSAVDRLVAAGMDPRVAHTRVVHEFGEPDVVGRAFATTPRGGLAVPTRFTRAAGWAGVAAALWWALWGLAIMATSAATVLDPWTWADEAEWVSWVGFLITLAVIMPLTYLAILGLLARAGAGLRDPWFTTVLLVAVNTTAFTVLGFTGATAALFGSPWVPWLLLMAPAALAAVSVARLPRVGLGRLRSDWLIAAAWPVGLTAYFLLEPLHLGPFHWETGHYLIGASMGGALAPLLLGVGLLARSGRLAAEKPTRSVSIPSTPVTAGS